MNDVIKIIIKLRFQYSIKLCNKEYHDKYRALESSIGSFMQLDCLNTLWITFKYNYRNIYNNHNFYKHMYTSKQVGLSALLPINY